MDFRKLCAMLPANRGAQGAPRGIDRIRVDVRTDFAGDIGLARRRQRQGDEGRLKLGILNNCAERIH